ncbi:hypothetical protein N658DRAFT_426514 [Parathielavia hyrcaniae]|uniref:Uncharacterized protein n=1 Tax=Parathielavia hyrcaniae TaxID=113614 RepID=A0AAN6T1U9_9PEZI|nr:hypothetical protein N658DRAFT_426514 [Parathielavia hyrcaniae]
MDYQLPIRTGRPPTDRVNKARAPCHFYARGSCSKGTACQFAHDGPGGPSSSSSGAVSPASRGQVKSAAPCRFFAAGNCAKGQSCPFAHDSKDLPKPSSAPTSTTSASLLPAPHSQARTDTRAQVACRFFAKGHCTNGDACPFAHDGGGATEGADDQLEGPDGLSYKQEEVAHDDWTRELGGALVKFEDGAAISKVSLPSDFSAVRLNKLPEGSSPTAVASLLSSMGLAISVDNVRVIKQTGGTHLGADITVEDPGFAKAVCSKLRLNAAASHIEAVPIPVPMPRGSSLHRVDCRRVHCSWHRPSRTAWLNFGVESIARKVHERLNAGVYKPSGFTVKANAPSGKGNRWNPVAWTVMLTDLPGTVTERDIYQAIPDFHKPWRVEMGDPSYDVNADVAVNIVKSMLLQLGPLEWWAVSGISESKRIKAQARFLDESHAREAVASLYNAPLAFSKTARLTVRLMTSARLKISARVYDALHERLASQTPAWQSQHIRFVAYPPHQGYRVLKLEGEDSKLVVQAKEALEHILSGEVARKGDKDVWNASLGRNGGQYRSLKQVERDHGVVVVRDRRKSQLRVFGPEEGCKRATEALGTLVPEDAASDSHIIELDPAGFEWACRGGFRALTTRLGDNKATFDIASTPKRILIGGSKADYATALAVITSRHTASTAAPSDSQAECPVCLTEPEEPICTGCSHLYCAGCFSNLCQAQGSGTTEFHISCIGGEGQCDHPFTLPELQDLLSSAAFEAVLSASFASHIRRHPADFRYCPTPDCGHIYRVASSSSSSSSPTTTTTTTTFTCPKCLVRTCTTCPEAHPGQTCAEHRDFGPGPGGREAHDRLKRELGIKDCPRCQTAMEKTEGCNHMTCRGCGAHLCWVCLADFDTSGSCYKHLNERHGGVYGGGDDGLGLGFW